ncbi:tetratricopeptide repeat protein [Actinomyces sp.]
MPNAEDVREILDFTSQLPWGPARSSQVAQAVVWADALEGEAELQIDAYLALTLSYQQGNEEWKALAPVSLLLSRFEKNSADFTPEQTEELAWLFKSAVAAAGRNPAVSIEQIDELITSLATFVSGQGFSMHAVHGVRAMIGLRTGRLDDAREALTLWRSTPSDQISDCEGCDPMKQINEAVAHKDWERAVATAMPLFDEEGACGAQPHGIRAKAMIPLLMSGRPDAAWEAHIRSYRHHRGVANSIDYIGLHLEYLVRSGRWQRALEILRDSIGMTSSLESASLLADYLPAAALTAIEATRRGHGNEAFGALCTGQSQWCQGPQLDVNTPLSEAAEKLSQWALDVASLFDQRNGNDYYTRLTREVLEAGPVDEQTEARAQGEWQLELVGEREAMPDPLSTIEGEELPARQVSSRTARAQAETIDQSNPYPPIDYSLPPLPASMQEAFDRYAAQTDVIGYNVETNLLTDWCLVNTLDVDELHFDESDPQAALSFASFSKTLLSLRKEHEKFQSVYERVAPVIHSMTEDAPLATPGFFARIFGRSQASFTRKDLSITQLELLRYSCELDRYSWLGMEAPSDLQKDAVAFCDAFVSQIASMTSTLNRGATKAEDIAAIIDCLCTCGEIFLDSEKSKQALKALDTIESLKPACLHSGTSEAAFMRTLSLEGAQLYLEISDYRRAAQLADQTLRLETHCDPYTAFFARLIICTASIKAYESAEAVSQALRLSEIITRTPLRSLGLSAATIISDAFEGVHRIEEAIELLEQTISRAGDSPFARLLTALIRLTLASYYLSIDQDEEAYETAMEAIDPLVASGNLRTASRAGSLANDAAKRLHDRPKRLAAIERALEIAKAFKAPHDVIALTRMAAKTYVETPTGKVSEADKERALQAVDAGSAWLDSFPEELDPQEMAFLRAGITYIKGWVYMTSHDHYPAIPLLQEAFTLQKEIKDAENYLFPLAALSQCYSELGDTDALHNLLIEVKETIKTTSLHSGKLRTLAREIEKELSGEGEA